MSNLNPKQQELVEQLVRDIEAKFPEAKFLDVFPSPESSNSLWIEVTRPDNEDREIELREYAAERAMDILLDFGYHLLVQPTTNGERKPVE
jgi:hypothetical protein